MDMRCAAFFALLVGDDVLVARVGRHVADEDLQLCLGQIVPGKEKRTFPIGFVLKGGGEKYYPPPPVPVPDTAHPPQAVPGVPTLFLDVFFLAFFFLGPLGPAASEEMKGLRLRGIVGAVLAA